MKTTFFDRFTSRKFLLTVGAVLAAVGGGMTHSITWPTATQAIVAAIVPFVLGQSWIEAMAAKFVPPAMQETLIENAAVQLANKYIFNKKIDVANMLQGAPVTPTTTTINVNAPVETTPEPPAVNVLSGLDGDTLDALISLAQMQKNKALAQDASRG